MYWPQSVVYHKGAAALNLGSMWPPTFVMVVLRPNMIATITVVPSQTLRVTAIPKRNTLGPGAEPSAG
jgi:hypothetical protein